MSSRRGQAKTRTISERAIRALGHEGAVALLGVARDLRSGVIPPETYDQSTYCGTACCIAGHLMIRLGVMKPGLTTWLIALADRDPAVWRLFSGKVPSVPALAADAIERYVLEGSDDPWGR